MRANNHLMWIAAMAVTGLIAGCSPSAGGGAQPASGKATSAEKSLEPVALARYQRQRLRWTRCAASRPADYLCAMVEVPLDYRHPDKAAITVGISRLRTAVRGKRLGVLLSNPGGPGVAGLDSPLQLRNALPKAVVERYDLVGFDPRGLNESSPIRCHLTEGELVSLHPYRPSTFGQDRARASAIAKKCAAHVGSRLAFINTRNTARDLDIIRAALGEQRISYLGWSWGAYLGAVYSQLFPTHAGAMVLDSSPDPGGMGRGTIRSWAESAQPAFEAWARWTAQRDDSYHLGNEPAMVRAAFTRLVAGADRQPVTNSGSDSISADAVLDGAGIRDLLRPLLVEDWPAAARSVARLSHASSVTLPSEPRAAAEPIDDNAASVLWAVMCGDNPSSWPREPERYRRDAVRDSVRYPLYGDFVSNITPCAFWPRDGGERETVTQVNNSVPSLVLQNQWDPATPEASGRAMGQAMKGSRLVYVKGGRGHYVYGLPTTPRCVADVVKAYLVTGRLPDSDVTCQA